MVGTRLDSIEVLKRKTIEYCMQKRPSNYFKNEASEPIFLKGNQRFRNTTQKHYVMQF